MSILRVCNLRFLIVKIYLQLNFDETPPARPTQLNQSFRLNALPGNWNIKPRGNPKKPTRYVWLVFLNLHFIGVSLLFLTNNEILIFFFTTILHRSLRNSFFCYLSICFFQFLFGLLFTLFYLTFWIPYLFGLLFSLPIWTFISLFSTFFFDSIAVNHLGFLPTFWLSIKI